MNSNLATLKYIHIHWCQSLAVHSCSTMVEPVFLHWIKICRFGNRITLQMESASIVTKRLDEWTSQPPTSFSVLTSNRLQNKQLVRWYPSPFLNESLPDGQLLDGCGHSVKWLHNTYSCLCSTCFTLMTWCHSIVWPHLMLMASKGLCAADQSGKRKRKGVLDVAAKVSWNNACFILFL